MSTVSEGYTVLSTEIQQQQPSHLSVASGDKLVRRRSQMLASIGTEEEISKQTSLVTNEGRRIRDKRWEVGALRCSTRRSAMASTKRTAELYVSNLLF